MTEIERIKRIVAPIAKKHGVERVWLFGSRARGEESANSDYDFLISKGKIRTLFEHMNFVDDLEAALGTHVDVITDGPGNAAFLEVIRNDEVSIYDSNFPVPNAKNDFPRIGTVVPNVNTSINQAIQTTLRGR